MKKKCYLYNISLKSSLRFVYTHVSIFRYMFWTFYAWIQILVQFMMSLVTLGKLCSDKNNIVKI